MKTCRKCLVSGRVQGVYYRGTTQNQANMFGVTGYARNLSDGRVEVLMCGEEQALDSLGHWLWQGPRFAEVEDIRCQSVEPANIPDDFSTA